MTTNTHLRLDTDLGPIDIAVHADRAPAAAAYVRQLVDDGLFDDTTFYRSTTLGQPDRGPLIQGGPLSSVVLGLDSDRRKVSFMELFETTDDTGLPHQNGTVSLARDLDGNGWVLPELFICLDDYPELDAHGRTEPDERGFPAFGTVVSGQEVVDAIGAREASGSSPFARLAGEILTEPVRILSATFID